MPDITIPGLPDGNTTDAADAEFPGSNGVTTRRFTAEEIVASALSGATPAPIGTAAPGVSTAPARGDHVHAHGNQAGGTLHADVVAGGASGFMTGAQATKLDGIETGADVTDATNVEAAGAVMETDFSGTYSADLTRVSAGLFLGLRSNRSATTAPTVTDDASIGYGVGSRWIDTSHDRAWECLDATAGSAVWVELGVRGVPAVGAVVSGRYYAAGGVGLGAATINLAGESGRCDLAPRYRRRAFGTLAGIGVQVQSGVAGASIRIVFYLPDANGWPGVRLWQSSIFSGTAFGFMEDTSGLPNLDLYPLLWYGIAHEGATPGPQIRSHNQADTFEIGGWAPGATPAPNPGSVIRRTGLTLAALPDPWVFNASELTALVTPPLIYVRPA